MKPKALNYGENHENPPSKKKINTKQEKPKYFTKIAMLDNRGKHREQKGH